MAGLLTWLMELGNSMKNCCMNLLGWNRDDDDDAGSIIVDPRLWSRNLVSCSHGQFSFAMVGANLPQIEDQAQVESGPDGLFVGVYDGHGGDRVSEFCYNNLFDHFTRIAQESGRITEDTLRNAITATENGFMDVVKMELEANREANRNVTAVGSCCLVALVWRGTLYVGNLGDSRAVIGRINAVTNKIVAEPLTRDDNVNVKEVRQEVQAANQYETDSVLFVRGTWRVKGHIQVSKAIGDAYLKRQDYSLLPNIPRLRLPRAINRPALSAEPSMVTRTLQSNDSFLICASDGLWENITNERAVKIVNKHPREAIARRLLRASIKAAARKKGCTYDAIKQAEANSIIRRDVHDDITVVVIFFNQEVDPSVPGHSIRGYSDQISEARFNLQGVA